MLKKHALNISIAIQLVDSINIWICDNYWDNGFFTILKPAISNIHALLETLKKLWYHNSQISGVKYRLLLWKPTYQPAEILEILKIYHLVNRVILEKGSPWIILSIQVFNPPHGFGITDLSKVQLSSRQIRVPEDDFTNNFNRNAGPGGICCRMAAQIMRAQINADHISCFHYHYPGSFIRNWKKMTDGKIGLVWLGVYSRRWQF